MAEDQTIQKLAAVHEQSGDYLFYVIFIFLGAVKLLSMLMLI